MTKHPINLSVQCLWALILIGCLQAFPANQRIFNGTDASIDEFPWMGNLHLNFLNYIRRECGAVVISEIFLLSSASCVYNIDTLASYFNIRAGVDRPNDDNVDRWPVSQIIKHPDYKNINYLNDIALIRINPAFNFSSQKIQPIKMSNRSSIANANLTMLGWGGTNPADPLALTDKLQQTRVQENVECTLNLTADPLKQFCAPGKFRLTNFS